jgi:hypothetical protein
MGSKRWTKPRSPVAANARGDGLACPTKNAAPPNCNGAMCCYWQSCRPTSGRCWYGIARTAIRSPKFPCGSAARVAPCETPIGAQVTPCVGWSNREWPGDLPAKSANGILPEIEIDLPLAEIYEAVEFCAEPAEEDEAVSWNGIHSDPRLIRFNQRSGDGHRQACEHLEMFRESRRLPTIWKAANDLGPKWGPVQNHTTEATVNGAAEFFWAFVIFCGATTLADYEKIAIEDFGEKKRPARA